MHVAAAGADIIDADYDVVGVGDFGDGVVQEFGGAWALQPDRWVLQRCYELEWLEDCRDWGRDLPLMLP